MVCVDVWGIDPQLVVLTVALCCTLAPSPGHADIYAHYSNRTSMLFEDLPALFGSPLPKDGQMGFLVESHPLNACSPIDPPPLPPPPLNASLARFIVLIRRFDCNFDIKVLHAQRAGFSAAIVYNMYSDTLLHMGFSDEKIAEEIQIPSVFTSYSAAQILKSFIIPERGAYVILRPAFYFPIWYYLIPFSWVVGIILVVMVTVLIVRCVQYRNRMRRNRLTREQLKKIPVHTFEKGDEYDVCAICLDEYEGGDRLRILPCSHAYHCRCVDPWLTQTKKTCPVCKQRVTRSDPDCSSSESESEGEGGVVDEEDSERTPLLRPTNPSLPASSGPDVATAVTTAAQCFGSMSRCDSPLLVREGHYSPGEDSEDDGHAQLLGRGVVGV
ncbi:E3 ubiquitin-protein ligase RNF167-like [Megalops cyprinoides]|uniref:E3 ubiquitin-protein ligase RNF167-like n=1 Tax=Megalops cyprinoides TaxID=118141 RepID=UPI00186426D7|nr:E3 ubiquitin-protein ligase RNF167-like [Megalops cyprinoides]